LTRATLEKSPRAANNPSLLCGSFEEEEAIVRKKQVRDARSVPGDLEGSDSSTIGFSLEYAGESFSHKQEQVRAKRVTLS
jgi:hypothetical protein